MAFPKGTDLELLKAQAKKLEMILDIKDRKYHLKTYKQCFIGKEAILPIINCGFATSEQTAIEFGNKLLKANIIDHVEKKHNFKNDCLFYKFIMDLADASDLNVLKEHRNKLSQQMETYDDSKIEHSMSVGSTNSQTKSSYATMNMLNPVTPKGAVSVNLDIVTPQTVTRQPSEDNDLYDDLYLKENQYKQQNVMQQQNTATPSGDNNTNNQSQIIMSLQSEIQELSMKYQQIEAMLNNNKNNVIISNNMDTMQEMAEEKQTEGGPGGMSQSIQYLKQMDINNKMMDRTPQLMNNWRNWGQQYSNFKVYKIGAMVYLQGCITGGIMDNNICQLPMDCRPSGTMTFCFDQHGGNNGRLRIMADGYIVPEYMNKTWIYLDGICFIAISGVSTILDVTPKLENGWTNFGGGYCVFKVYKIGDIVHLQGCIKGGKMGSNVCRLRNRCRPNGMMTFVFDQHQGINGRLRIMNDGLIIPEYMNKTWIYLDGISFVAKQ